MMVSMRPLTRGRVVGDVRIIDSAGWWRKIDGRVVSEVVVIKELDKATVTEHNGGGKVPRPR